MIGNSCQICALHYNPSLAFLFHTLLARVNQASLVSTPLLFLPRLIEKVLGMDVSDCQHQQSVRKHLGESIKSEWLQSQAQLMTQGIAKNDYLLEQILKQSSQVPKRVLSTIIQQKSIPQTKTHTSIPEKRTFRNQLTKKAVQHLRDWFIRNYDHPFPSSAQKKRLSQETGLDLKQVQNWFINSRKRFWSSDKRRRQEQEGSTESASRKQGKDIIEQIWVRNRMFGQFLKESEFWGSGEKVVCFFGSLN